MKAKRSAKGLRFPTADAFANPIANLGKATRNITAADTYALEPITRERALLDFAYRGSWVIGVGVDAVAEDMTREGVAFTGEEDPAIVDLLVGATVDLDIWTPICDAIKWSRLYGGSLAVMLIDGQDPEEELDQETIGEGQFKGLYAIERWLLSPAWNNLDKELGPNLSKPLWYMPTVESPVYRGVKIHHSRVIRFDGITMPYYQRMAEWGWGMSIVERVWDRLTAFDSVTVGAAQLVHKAYLRTVKVEGLREILAAKGVMLEALTANFDMIRQMQTTEGLTVLDAKDDFIATSYTFAGLSDMVLQFGQQIAGSFQIPLVRFFGASPLGMNATGESDFRMYYDGIAREQERKRGAFGRLFDVMYRSETGRPPPESFGFQFNPLWKISRAEKADIAARKTQTILSAMESAVIGRKAALQELKQQADETGVWSNITDEMIEAAEEEPPPAEGAMEGGPFGQGGGSGHGSGHGNPFDPNPLPDSFGPGKELPKSFGEKPDKADEGEELPKSFGKGESKALDEI